MKRILACLFIIAVFPLVIPMNQNDSTKISPYSTTALAGHSTQSGGWCQCGAEGCICDPGETPGGNIVARPSNGSPDGEDIEQGYDPGVDPASGMLILALAFLFWIRMR